MHKLDNKQYIYIFPKTILFAQTYNIPSIVCKDSKTRSRSRWKDVPFLPAIALIEVLTMGSCNRQISSCQLAAVELGWPIPNWMAAKNQILAHFQFPASGFPHPVCCLLAQKCRANSCCNRTAATADPTKPIIEGAGFGQWGIFHVNLKPPSLPG